jgi:hypothetical protein
MERRASPPVYFELDLEAYDARIFLPWCWTARRRPAAYFSVIDCLSGSSCEEPPTWNEYSPGTSFHPCAPGS